MGIHMYMGGPILATGAGRGTLRYLASSASFRLHALRYAGKSFFERVTAVVGTGCMWIYEQCLLRCRDESSKVASKNRPTLATRSSLSNLQSGPVLPSLLIS